MRLLCIALSILAILLALFIIYLLWFPIWEMPPISEYDVLKDTLIIVLTAVMIVIAVMGFAVYQIVSQRLRDETGRRIMEESRRWITRLATSTSYSFWELGFHDEAIRLTREALDEYASGLAEKKPKNEELIGAIRNNLASYFSQTNQERNLARGYAAYIHSISHKFPKHRETWEKTYQEVFEAFPD